MSPHMVYIVLQRGDSELSDRESMLSSIVRWGMGKRRKYYSDKEFNTLLDSIQQQVVYAAMRNNLRKSLTDSIEEYQREFNESPAFWQLTIGALLDSTFFYLSRFYESGHDNRFVGVNRFVEIAEDHIRGLDRSKVVDHKQLTSKDDPLVSKLKGVRDNLMAHTTFDAVLDANRIRAENPLTNAQISTLIDRGVEIMNYYSTTYKNSTWSTELVGEDDYAYVLKAIREKLS